MDAISTELQKAYPDSNPSKALLLTGLQDALAEGDRPNLLILMAAVGVLLLVACADVAGLLLAFWLRGLVLRLVPPDSFGVTTLPVGGPAVAFAVLVTLATTALIGIVPAWLGARSSPATDLETGSRTSESRGRTLFRQALVTLQVAMSVILLVAAALLGRSLMRLRTVDPGFRTDGLLTAQVALTGVCAARGRRAV